MSYPLSAFQRDAMRTLANAERVRTEVGAFGVSPNGILHAALGLATEAGEFADIVKRHEFYGKGLDKTHLAEELGDTLWYAACGAEAMGLTLDEIGHRVINKLRVRYPEKFTQAAALARADKP